MKEINVSDFRQNVTALIDGVATTGQGFTVAKRNKPQVVVLPKVYGSIATPRANYKEWLALMYTEHLMPGAPDHLKEPQRLELESLPIKKLQGLLMVDKLPVKKSIRVLVTRTVGKTVIERLERRWEIAQAIIEAREEGLYEAAEHFTGEIDLTE